MAVEDRYRRMPFGEAIEFLRQKIAIPTERWDDISESEHDAAFVVAGAKGSLLTDLQRAVTRAIADGQGVEQFTETFKQISQNWVHRGDKDWRARIIFQTNMRMAYAAGRYQYQLDPDVLRLQPYLQYLHGGSQDPRPSHIALHERVFRARELPFYPPNGFGCSCRTVSLDEDKLAARGLVVSEIRRGDLVPYELPDGQRGQARVQPDKGFDYVPGQTRADERQRMIEAVIARLEPEQARWVREEIARIDRAIFKPAQPEEIYEALGQWERELLSIDQGNLSAAQLEQALDAEWMVAELRNSPRERLRGVKNSEGVQAAAAVYGSGDALRLQWIATAPQNLTSLENENRIIGSSRALVVGLARESISLGYDGKIELTSLGSSIQFWQKLGFDQAGGKFSLTSQRARELLRVYKGVAFMASSDVFHFDTEEIDRLEGVVGPILAIPSLEKIQELEAYKVRRRAEIKALREQRQQQESNG